MGKRFKKLGVLAMMGLLILTACSSGTNSGAQKFIVGMECGYAPFNWIEPNGDNGGVSIGNNQYCNGYDVEIAKRIAGELDRELVIQKITWEGLILSVQSDQIDAIIAGMSPTSERKQEIDFSDVYHLGEFGVMVRKDSLYANATTVNDFADMHVSAQQGTFHVDLMEQLTGAKKQAPMKDFPTMTVALMSGELDGFVAEDASGAAITASNPELKYIPLVGTGGYVVKEEYAGTGIGMKKGNPLVQEVNEALSKITPEERRTLMDAAIAANS